MNLQAPGHSFKANPLALVAIALGTVSCAQILLALVVPWYQSDMFNNSAFAYRDEYGIFGFSRAGVFHGYSWDPSSFVRSVESLMGLMALFLVASLAATVVTGLTSFRLSVKLGAVAGTITTMLLVLASSIFYFRITDSLNIDHFSGTTLLNRTEALTTGPALGWWLVVAAATTQAAQVLAIVYSAWRLHGSRTTLRIPLSKGP